MLRIKCLLPILFLLFTQALQAQSVGLVLSGGGAKGLYHIGVIKALEENGIPIDYISGTSMGAIIGGLYATGMTPEDMEKLFTSEQIKYWLSGRIENRYKFYFKEMRQSSAMLNLRFDPSRSGSKTPQLPLNLISTNQLDMAFVEYCAQSTAVSGGDFDELFVPFRCIATDAVNHREIIYRDGDLGEAVRASMTIPLVFRPIKTDSTLLYDGGMFDNFPWKVMMTDFEPDIMIGSKCIRDRGGENAESNVIDLVAALTMAQTDFGLPRETDVLIDRVLDDVSMMDFDKAAYVINLGYHDALEQMGKIKETVSRRRTEEEMAQKRGDYRSALPRLVFEDFEIEGLASRQREYVRKLLGLTDMDEGYDFTQFRYEYFKILAEGEINGDFPRVTFDSLTRKFRLRITMTTKPSLKLMVGGNVSSAALNQAYLGIEYKTIGRTANTYWLDGRLSPFYTSAALGGRNDFMFNVPVYLEYGGTMDFYNFFRSNYGFLSKGNDLTYSKYRDYYLSVSGGTPFGRHSVINLTSNAGINEYLYFQQTGYDDSEVMDRTRINYFGLKFELERKSMNYALYPNRGVHQIVSVIGVTGRERFEPGASGMDMGQSRSATRRFWVGARFMREHYMSWRPAKWLNFGYMVDLVYSDHPQLSNDYATNLSMPAFTPTPHSKIVYMKEFRSKMYAAAGVIPIFHIGPSLYFKASAYAFLPYEMGLSKENIRQDIRYIFDGALVYQTIVGPMSLSVSKYDVKRNNWFLTFNFGYALFNKKGLFY